MLSSHQSPARPTTGSILLLEEYEPVAAAIASALRKFAPGYDVVRTDSIAEAEQVALTVRPDVVILDVDPPWTGISSLLQHLRVELPSTRALIVGAEIPADILAQRGSFGALQFIGKPFELGAFGAAVQAVLGPWHDQGLASPRGTLGALNVIDLILVHCASGGSVVVDFKIEAGRTGKVYITAGQISHAETGKLIGADALTEILGWDATGFSERKLAALDRRTLQKEWVAIVVEALGRVKLPPPARLSPPDQPLRRKIAKRKLVVVDDTEMLLIFVEDVLATANPELEITTAVTGTDGFEQIRKILPDLVLLDYSLPDINGDEVCRLLLDDPQTKHVPVLMMSGHVAQMTATAKRFANVVATIEKPFLSDALVRLVERTLAAGPQQIREIVRPTEITQKPAARPARPPAAEAPLAAPTRQPSPPQPIIESSATPLLPTAAPLTRTPATPPLQPQPVSPIAAPAPPSVVLPVPRPEGVRATTEPSVAVLGFFLEVISMQLTPQLQMGAIRAKPNSHIVSLHLSSAAARGAIPPETAFQLGPAELDAQGRILNLRVLATKQPWQPGQTRSAFEIGGVALIPNHTRTRVQLTPAGTTPMTIELVAHLELGSVQLSATFQVAQLILRWPSQIVHVTLDPKAAEKTGAAFEASEIKLDNSGRIAELLLKSVTARR